MKYFFTLYCVLVFDIMLFGIMLFGIILFGVIWFDVIFSVFFLYSYIIDCNDFRVVSHSKIMYDRESEIVTIENNKHLEWRLL